MRVLIDRVTGADRSGDPLEARMAEAQVSEARLGALYAPPSLPWLRVNMVTTADGAATGADGRTGSINNAADRRVFEGLRAMSDAVVVGAGTARTERYRPAAVPLVLVSRRGELPETLRGGAPGQVLLATCARAPGLAESREIVGADNVLVLGERDIDLQALRASLVRRGFRQLLSEGGPHLLGDLLRAGVADELCMTMVPRLVAGTHLRIAAGAPVDVSLDLRLLLEVDGTLLGRWFVGR